MEKSANSQKSRIASVIFMIAFVIEILVMCMVRFGLEIPYRGRILQLAAALFGVKLLLTHYSWKEWLLIVLLGIAGTLQFFSVHSILVIEIILMIAASKDMNIEKLLKIYFGITFAAFIITVFMSFTGLAGDLTSTRNYRDNGLETRYCFGYSHPNVFYSNLIMVTMAGLLVLYKKLRGIHYALLTGINIIFYLLADSRTGFLVLEILIVGFYLYYKIPKIFECSVVFWLCNVALACMILSSYIFLYLPREQLEGINRILTGRIWLARDWIWSVRYQWPLLPTIDAQEYILDMGYVHVMANWGIILGTIYIVALFYNLYRFYKRKMWSYVIVLMSYSIFTFVEAHAFSMYFIGNIMFILMLGWKTNESVESEKQNT